MKNQVPVLKLATTLVRYSIYTLLTVAWEAKRLTESDQAIVDPSFPRKNLKYVPTKPPPKTVGRGIYTYDPT